MRTLEEYLRDNRCLFRSVYNQMKEYYTKALPLFLVAHGPSFVPAAREIQLPSYFPNVSVCNLKDMSLALPDWLSDDHILQVRASFTIFTLVTI